ncbi:acyl-CoA dehydrogenase family protein [Pseudonocardia sp. GCM10023141]|uniref:acyl-CoA dehydrogenase family protein n=1 Tax=Pseudonocardia sp. GCM10023141 TaxID=3252653 RepID=UPI0036067259
MLLGLNTDQEQLRSVLRSFLGASDPASEPDPRDPVSWQRLARDLDLVGLAVPESLGGSGAGLVEVAVVMGEMGRVLYGGPFLSAVLALEALCHGTDAAAGPDTAELVRQIVAGEALGTVIGPVLAGASTMRADRSDAGWVGSGQADHVLDGDVADVFVVLAETPDGPGWFVVDRRVPASVGVEVEDRPSLDPTRPLPTVRLAGVALRPLSPPGGAAALLDRLLAVGAVVLAAEQVGAAERCLEMAVEHATRREQFGRPIGSFQAVKHRCADMLLAVEAAKWAALHAAWSVQELDADAARVAGITKAAASDAFTQAAGGLIQVLGGIGYTWEHPAHRYFRRAVASRELFGAPDVHRARVAAAMLGQDCSWIR